MSDYLQKGTGTERYTVLANRIANLVEGFRAEQQTAATRRRFTKLIEDAVDLITVVDDTGTFTYVSPAIEPLLGYTADALLGTHAFDYIHPDDTDEMWAQFTDLLAGAAEAAPRDIRLRHADGTWVWVENRGKILRDDPDVHGVVAYTRDITARKARERTLRQYAAIVENMSDVAYTVDQSFHVTLVNRASIDYAGVPRSAIEGTDVRELTEEMIEDEAARDLFITALTNVLEERSRNERVRFDIETTVGPVRSELDISALVTDDGTTEGAVVISRAIPADER
ncbi:PAS domain-containing protein [Halorarius litoreus]|uniref:PAS domain-containing protein n=1 Tax=Halorarius litoreus TaxID=2962676 RepID=UPI0020CF43C7|nr:PAS domain S-box protein [Halorarius litoreus]